MADVLSLGVTGPREVEPLDRLYVYRMVRVQLDVGGLSKRLVSGAQFGVDTIAARAARDTDVPVVLAIPVGASFNESLLDEANQYGWEVRRVEGLSGASAGVTVALSRVLLAFPETRREEQRSSTWWTVRKARSAGIEIRFFPLSREDPWVEEKAKALFEAKDETW